MALQDKYINPFTDYGFKKLFGTEINKDLLIDFLNQVFYDKLTFIYLEMPNFKKTELELETDFDKWMYVLRYLPYLQSRPAALQERIFQKLFETAEIARFDPEEKARYEESLKYYRDLKNVVDTSYEEGREEGKAEKEIEVIIKSQEAGLDLETISKITGRSIEEIKKITFFDKSRGQVEKEIKNAHPRAAKALAEEHGSVDFLFGLTTKHKICQRTKNHRRSRTLTLAAKRPPLPLDERNLAVVCTNRHRSDSFQLAQMVQPDSG